MSSGLKGKGRRSGRGRGAHRWEARVLRAAVSGPRDWAEEVRGDSDLGGTIRWMKGGTYLEIDLSWDRAEST